MKGTGVKMSEKKQVSAKNIINETDTKLRNEYFNQYVKDVTPKNSIPKNTAKAFLIGGIICVIGQALTNYYIYMGADEDTGKMYTTITLVFLSIVLTGVGVYQKIAKFGGAGTLVPITGFANSMAAPAVEYKKEGQVFGIGCKIFTIAGPVILYGIFCSWVLGVIYYILKLLGAV